MANSRKFTPIPIDVRDFPKWLRTFEHEAADIQMTIKNEGKKTEFYSLYSVFLIGMRWKQDVEMWPKPDWNGYKLNDVKENSARKILPNLLKRRKPFWRRNGRSKYSRIGICIRAFNAIFSVCFELQFETIQTSVVVWKKHFGGFLR